MTTKAQREINHKLKVFEHANNSGNVSFICRYFGISRDTFCRWKKNFRNKGEKGLINSKPCPENPKLRYRSSDLMFIMSNPFQLIEFIMFFRRIFSSQVAPNKSGDSQISCN